MVFFLQLFRKTALWNTSKLHSLYEPAGCPLCHPTNSVKTLKETQSNDPNQWPGYVVSSSTAGLLTEGLLLPLRRVSVVSTVALYHDLHAWVFGVKLSHEDIVECLRVVAMATNFGTKIVITGFV